jgi:hypothetical protein
MGWQCAGNLLGLVVRANSTREAKSANNKPRRSGAVVGAESITACGARNVRGPQELVQWATPTGRELHPPLAIFGPSDRCTLQAVARRLRRARPSKLARRGVGDERDAVGMTLLRAVWKMLRAFR